MFQERLKEIVRETVEALGFAVVETVWISGKQRATLRVVIHKKGGDISTEDCAKVSEVLSARLDVEDIVAVAYNLIVESPGVERKIASPEEYDIFSDREFRFVMRDPSLIGRKDSVLVGKVKDKTVDGITIVAPEGEFTLTYANIAKAQLYFDLKRYL